MREFRKTSENGIKMAVEPKLSARPPPKVAYYDPWTLWSNLRENKNLKKIKKVKIYSIPQRHFWEITKLSQRLIYQKMCNRLLYNIDYVSLLLRWTRKELFKENRKILKFHYFLNGHSSVRFRNINVRLMSYEAAREPL